MTRQIMAAVLWHLDKSDAAYVQLRAVRRMNEKFQIVGKPIAKSADAFAKRNYRRAYKVLVASLWNDRYSYIPLPAGLADSGAADAIRRALNAGADGQFAVALANANQALKAEPGSQATRFVAGVANLATMHPRQGRDMLFDAMLGYDANPEGSMLTNWSLTAVYVLVAVGDGRSARPS